MSVVLRNKISAVRRKQALVSAGAGVAGLVGMAMLLVAGGMVLDWLVEFPYGVRAGLLGVDLVVLGYVLCTQVIGPVVFGPDEEEIALMVERAVPEFKTRLIASVQLARPGGLVAGASAALAEAMIRQTEELAGPMEFAEVVKADPVVRVGALAGFIGLLGISGFVYGGHMSGDLLKRVFLVDVPVPRQTRVECATQNRIIAIGDNVTLEATAWGVVPKNGRVRLDYDSGREQTFTIEPTQADSRRFVRTVENVQESFKYAIRLNDGRSEKYTVQALPRPVMTGMELVQHYPAYTKRAAQKRAPGDLVLLAGSELGVQVKASKPIQQGAMHLVGLEKNVTMTVGGADRTMLAGTIAVPAKGLSGFSIRLTEDHGIRSKGETVYPVDVVPDKEPTVRVLWPDRKEELATQRAKALISFEVADDFGVEKIRLHYRVDKPISPDEMTQGQENFIELDLSNVSGEGRRLMRRRYEMDLMNLKPMPLEGCAVEYWLEVEDGNNVTGPGRALSDRYRVKVVSEVAKRADLMNRLNDQLGTIDQVTQDEEKLNQNLGGIILEGSEKAPGAEHE